MALALRIVEAQPDTLSDEIDALAALQFQAKVLEAQIKARRDTILSALQAQGLERSDVTALGHSATVVTSTTQRISRERAEEILSAEVLAAITSTTTTTYVKVR